jgi:hypothetical protein
METREVSSMDVALDCVLLIEQDKQYMDNVTLWHVDINIVTLERQRYVLFFYCC